MHFNNVSILSVAHLEPPNVVTSEEIEQQLEPLFKKYDIKPGIIASLTGIKERRQWDVGFEPSDAATKVGIIALEKANISKSKVDLIINTSVTKDYIEPSVASIVHGNLGLKPDCINYDLGNACLGFVNAMEVAATMIEKGAVDYALIVDGETSRYFLEGSLEKLQNPDATDKLFRELFANFTLGSGAAAMVLTRRDLAPDSPQLIGSVTMCDTADQHNKLCVGQVDGIVTDTSGLLIHGLTLSSKTFEKAKRELSWDKKQLDHLIIHQVSETHSSKFVQAIKEDMRKLYKTYPEYGNMGPASIIFTLSKASEETIKKGDRVAVMGIGSGINCSMMEVIW